MRIILDEKNISAIKQKKNQQTRFQKPYGNKKRT